MAKRKDFKAGDIVRPHALNGSTLYPVDSSGKIPFPNVSGRSHTDAFWEKVQHLRGFEPFVVENGTPYNAYTGRDSDYIKVNYAGTIYAVRVNSIVKIAKD